MIRFIDEHKDRFGVEAICRTLGATQCGFITSRGYRAAKTRPVSARSLRDAVLGEELRRIHAENYGVYGYRKMWHAMRRAGWEIGRDQVARLMKAAGLTGVRRGRKPVTTRPSIEPDHRPDLVKRQFVAQGPNRLWVADITYVRMLTGFCYVAFITDVCTRKIVGWAVAATLHTQSLPLQALEHALLSTEARLRAGRLVHHSDRGVQYVSLSYTETLAAYGVTASVGSVGDSYDNALAEAVNGLYKAEIIHSRRVWPSVTAVEMATMDFGAVVEYPTSAREPRLPDPGRSRGHLHSTPDGRVRCCLTTERNPGRFRFAWSPVPSDVMTSWSCTWNDCDWNGSPQRRPRARNSGLTSLTSQRGSRSHIFSDGRRRSSPKVPDTRIKYEPKKYGGKYQSPLL